jgi:hypothetical protein
MTTKSTSLRIARVAKLAYEKDWPLSKSRYLFTKGGFNVCSKCASFNQKRFALDDLWQVVNDPVNFRDQYLLCDNCGQKIKRAEQV